MIVVHEGICRVEGSPFLEAEKPTMGSLQLIRRESAPQTQQLDQLWRLGQGSPPGVLVMSLEKLKSELYS